MSSVLTSIRAALSSSRLETYEKAMQGCSDHHAMNTMLLYKWNADISGDLLFPLQIGEVVIRNAISDALVCVYGHDWHLSKGFEQSLPDPSYGYSPRKDLQQARKGAKSLGQVIPELKFVFWQKMFTKRYDDRIWQAHLHQVMPNLAKDKTLEVLRGEIYAYLEAIRLLRNRIAHHEPIFNRDILENYHKIITLVRCRCLITAEWLDNNQGVTNRMISKPPVCTHVKSPHGASQ